MNPAALVLSVAVALVGARSAFSQGPLNPPGAPGPTMKSLEQIDARVDEVNAKAEKRTPISALPYTITLSGSYYLTGALNNGSGENGITINANDVTIDLMGFTLTSATPTSSGIFAGVGRRNITVRNGFVAGWVNGVNLAGRHVRVEGITARDNSAGGIVTGDASVVVDCVSGVNGGAGITVAGDGVIHRCAARENAGNGLVAGAGSVVSQSSARENGGLGIGVGPDSTVQGCATHFNKGTNIAVANGCLVARCTAGTGDSHGIAAGSNSLVLENACNFNGTSGHSGIFVNGGNSRIESNLMNGNFSRGMTVTGVGNLIVKNSATQNGTNYVISVNNKVGTILTPTNSGAINGSSGGGLGTNDPWANFAY